MIETPRILLLAVAGAAAAAAAPCLFVAAEHIRIADLAPHVPALENAKPDVVIGYAPEPGRRRVFSPEQLTRFARIHGRGETAVEGVCIERETTALTKDTVERAVRKAVGEDSVRIEVLDFDRRPAPRGTLEFPSAGRRASLGAAAGEPVVWHGRVIYGARRSHRVWVRLRLWATRSQVIALRQLPAGLPISRDAITVQRMDVSPAAERAVASVEEVVGARPRRSIPAAAPVLARNLTLPMQVERGDRVEVTTHCGTAMLRFEAVAEAEGRAGEKIIARNPLNGNRFAAFVVARGRVEVRAR